jgi:transcription elongation GreA/GreB family factor
MTISRTLRKYIEAGRLDEIESAWLAQMDAEPGDQDFFISVSRALKGSGEETLARSLLDLLYEEWQGEDWLEPKLALLKEIGQLLHESTELHAEILSLLRELYRGKPSLEGFIEQVGLHRAVEDIAKTWNKVASLRAIMQFEVESIVWMKGKGAGRVTEVNFELGSFKIDFERSPGLRVGFGGATKLMNALAPDHILRRKIEAPEELIAIKERDPGELLMLALRSYDEARSATQIRESLAGIVSEKEWSSWWSSARKNPQVITEGKGARQQYRAASSSAHAEEAVSEAFEAATIDGKLELFRRNAERNETLRQDLSGRLLDIAARSKPTAVAERFAIAHALRDAVEFSATAEWAPRAMMAATDDPIALIGRLGDRVLREGAYDLAREILDNWLDLFVAALDSEEDPRLLENLAAAVEETQPERLIAFYDRVLAHPRKQAAAFVWLAERARASEAVLDRKPLRFMQELLATSYPRELEPFKSRLRKLLEDGGPIAQLIQRLEPEQAAGAEDLLKRSNLEEYLRGPLIESLHMRFPDRREAKETPLYATQASIDARRAELKELREVEIPTNRKAIEEARELGDLRENFEYKSARQRHEYLAARQGALQADLARAQPLDLKRVDAEEVRVASRVLLRQPDGGEQELVILGPWESDPDRNIVSYDSDLARALLGKAAGDQVEFGGDALEIVTIAPWQG